MRVTGLSSKNSVFLGVSLLVLAACGGEPATPAPTRAETVAEEISITDENARFDALLKDTLKEQLAADPRFASSLNVSQEEAGGRYKDRLGVPGLAGYRQGLEREERFEKALSSFDPADLTEERREYLAVLQAGQEAEDRLYAIAEEAGYALAGGFRSPYNITQIGGLHVDLPQFMTQSHELITEDDTEAYITRLNLFDEQFAGAVEIFEYNAEAGVLAPDFAIEGAIENARTFIADPVEANPLYTHVADYLDEVEFEDEADILARTAAAIETSVYPAYRELIAALEERLDDATHDAGIWDIPQGPALYEALIRVNAENLRSGEEVHELGLSEVARIQAEMESLFEEIGMTEGTIGDRLSALTSDPEQVFPNTEEGKEELLAYVRQLASQAENVMDDYFLQTPSIPFEVRPVPAYAEKGAPGGYYNSPPEDGSRPGLYFINLRDTAAQPKFSLPTLTYHEGVPGHHFQLALAVDDKDTPLLVREAGSTGGLAEGWALYSEKFAEEIGLYKDDPYGDIGRLRDELFRAVRLVVDTGMHAKRWSREDAIDYMVRNAGMNPGGVETEIERYSVWPAQALSYKTGMIRIQELRERAEAALGEDFDVAAFHYQILRGGGAPLAVLEQRIDRWIEAGGPRPDLD
jgi:uncharacterized protein (DUF885 family)